MTSAGTRRVICTARCNEVNTWTESVVVANHLGMDGGDKQQLRRMDEQSQTT
ncbi:MAG: hypothetical protein NVS3B14_19020 [Ktedonobacteraceae bacterium]